ncbi:MAG TPA: hypothetical protein VFS43_41405 [Polyangiaceae bacterium]|nr:hypothetical protein [Polyangiaceae bacterium]
MSELGLVRAVAHLHGHLGWLAAAALAHPAWILRGGRRRARAAVALSTALTTLAVGLGLWLYPHYRACIKHELFVEAPAFGWLFERKEHAAFGALAFAWAGCLAHAAAPSARSPEARRALARAAWLAFASAALFALGAAAAGTAVASVRGFEAPGPCGPR